MASPFLDRLDPSDVRAILGAATTRQFSSHAIVYEQGLPAGEFFLLAAGRARYFCISPSGQKMLLHWLKPGDTLGIASLLQNAPTYRVGAETVLNSSMLVWTRRSML